MAENKNSGMRRAPALTGKQQDQVLGGGDALPAMGKIAGPASSGTGEQRPPRKPRSNNRSAPKPQSGEESTPPIQAGSQGDAPVAGQGKPAGQTRGRGQGRKPQTSQPTGGTVAQSNQANGQKGRKPQASQSTGGTAAQDKASVGRRPQGRAPRSTKQSAGTIAASPAGAAMRQNSQNNKSKAQGGSRWKKTSDKPAVRVYFLGGLNEIGKNFTLFECEGDMIIVDCGLAFPDEDMLGVDIVIPDFSFVEKNKDKIRGIVITHGHEDHIGAIPYLLKRMNVPVYGTALTVGLIEGKLKEHNLASSAKLIASPAGSRICLGCMEVEMIHVNHSIADAVALAIRTPAGTLVHTGDFKIDFTPVEGEMIDLARFAQLGGEGVLALFADSTNAERAGYTQTEQTVNHSLEGLFARAEGKRIIVATFASSISRVQMVINCAVKYGRKVALSGRSMLNVMGIATELGYLHVPDGVLIDLNLINRYENGQVVLITTGSQGEPMSALTRMAFSDHRQVEVSENDFIIISARPIPGNEKTVGTVVDELLKKGSTVIYESMYDVHVSGHACSEELKLIHALVKPKFFVPVHGEHKHLRKSAGVAIAMGIPKEHIFIGDVGNVVEIQEDYIKQLGDVPAGAVMVDGLGVGDVGSIVLRDRKHLAEDGLIVVVCSIQSSTGQLVAGPDIVSRGFVYVRESETLMDQARAVVRKTLLDCTENKVRDWSALKNSVKDGLSRFLYQKTKRNPMILPIIMEV